MSSRVASVIRPGHLAVVTGAASGIGRAVARRLAKAGMAVMAADVDATALAASFAADDTGAAVTVRTAAVDVSSAESVAALAAEAVAMGRGPVRMLVNCAGVGTGGGAFADLAKWERTVGINFWGVLNACQAFVPGMVASGLPCIVVNVGSKQGITAPPGNLAYNVSKAGVKVYTEGLQHELRNTPKPSDVSAHLLIPGWVNTGIVANTFKAEGRDPSSIPFSEEKPASGAWMPDQVVDYMLQGLEQDQFYILCPDNEVDVATDHKRILWAAGDIVESRTPLSRWDPQYADAFKDFLAQPSSKSSSAVPRRTGRRHDLTASPLRAAAALAAACLVFSLQGPAPALAAQTHVNIAGGSDVIASSTCTLTDGCALAEPGEYCHDDGCVAGKVVDVDIDPNGHTMWVSNLVACGAEPSELQEYLLVNWTRAQEGSIPISSVAIHMGKNL
ncbi:hypothetical protein HK405_011925, partial [Cladochytrium tenue]